MHRTQQIIILFVVAAIATCPPTSAQPFPLSFPLRDGPSVDPWSAVIIGVMDHSLIKPYGASGHVLTFTGEYGDRDPLPVPGTRHFKFANAQGSNFFVNGNYRPGDHLAYEGHPGIDYFTGGQKVTVFAAADGITIDRAGCEGEVILYIGGGYFTRYIHLDSLNASVTDDAGQYAVGKFVARGTPIGIAGGQSCSGNRNKYPVDWNVYGLCSCS
jgi:murein DD-endopeptidase MepM/ murein hydrolase activator NlpD